MSLDQIIDKAADLTLQTLHIIVLSAFLTSKQLAEQLAEQLAKRLGEQLTEQAEACLQSFHFSLDIIISRWLCCSFHTFVTQYHQ